MQNMDFWFFWKIFKKQWRIIMVVAFTAGIATGVCSKLFIKPVYRSTVSLYFGKVTENSSTEKLMMAGGAANLGETASQLALGSSLSSDYKALINFDIIAEGVHDELAKSGKWNDRLKSGLSFSASADLVPASRIMKISIDSSDPLFSQEVATIYAKEFINKIQKLIGIQNSQIIEEPGLNFNPVYPNIRKSIITGLVVGFAASFVICILFRMLDRTFNNSEDVSNALNVPVVGQIHKDKDYSLDQNNPLLFAGPKMTETNRSQIVEDFRVFRVNLINRKKENNNQDGDVIAVTSSQAKEGKTFCTANLGASLAEAGYKVLLIDCDTGDRGLQNYFGKSNETGLMNILSGEAKFEDAVKHNLNNSQMDVLFCGNKKVNSANLMISPKFKELMQKLKKEYDYAFLDVSCHLGTADIVSAGSNADSVMLLVRAGKTDEETAQKTVEALKRANLDVSGVILNGVEDK